MSFFKLIIVTFIFFFCLNPSTSMANNEKTASIKEQTKTETPIIKNIKLLKSKSLEKDELSTIEIILITMASIIGLLILFVLGFLSFANYAIYRANKI